MEIIDSIFNAAIDVVQNTLEDYRKQELQDDPHTIEMTNNNGTWEMKT